MPNSRSRQNTSSLPIGHSPCRAGSGHSVRVDGGRPAEIEAVVSALEAVRLRLSDLDDSRLGEYRDQLSSANFAPAFLCLVEAAHSQDAPREVWEMLLAASESIDFDQREHPYFLTVRVVRQHMHEAAPMLSHGPFAVVHIPEEDEPGIVIPGGNLPVLCEIARGDVKQLLDIVMSDYLGVLERRGIEPSFDYRPRRQRPDASA
jgi:hypothetical protein